MLQPPPGTSPIPASIRALRSQRADHAIRSRSRGVVQTPRLGEELKAQRAEERTRRGAAMMTLSAYGRLGRDPRPVTTKTGKAMTVCEPGGCGAQPDPRFRTCANCRVWSSWLKRCQHNPALRLDHRTRQFIAGCVSHGNAAAAD